MDFDALDSREVALVPDRAALLVIDVQNFSCRREGGEFAGLPEAEFQDRFGWFFEHIERESLPNMARLQARRAVQMPAAGPAAGASRGGRGC